MNKQEAIAEMEKGNKVTHNLYDPFEWTIIEDGRVVTEEGYSIDSAQFFSFRTSKLWDEGWSLFTDSTPTL